MIYLLEFSAFDFAELNCDDSSSELWAAPVDDTKKQKQNHNSNQKRLGIEEMLSRNCRYSNINPSYNNTMSSQIIGAGQISDMSLNITISALLF